MASSEKRTRGPNKQTPWKRRPEDGASVLRLALDTSDPVQRARLEAMYECTYSLRRALQRDALARIRAYWAATHERAPDHLYHHATTRPARRYRSAGST